MRTEDTSSEKTAEYTDLVCPESVNLHIPVALFHRLCKLMQHHLAIVLMALKHESPEQRMQSLGARMNSFGSYTIPNYLDPIRTCIGIELQRAQYREEKKQHLFQFLSSYRPLPSRPTAFNTRCRYRQGVPTIQCDHASRMDYRFHE